MLTTELHLLMQDWQELAAGSPWWLEFDAGVEEQEVPLLSVLARDPGSRPHVRRRLILKLGHSPDAPVILDMEVPDFQAAFRAMVEGLELNVAGSLVGYEGPGTAWPGLPHTWLAFTNHRAGEAWGLWLRTRLR
jgi:hypothetical protein